MKIWTITTDHEGTQTAVHLTKEAAEAQAVEIVTAWFERSVAADGEPRDHTDWRESYSILCDTLGFMDCLTFEEHDISAHPAINGADLELGKAIAHLSSIMSEDGYEVTGGDLIDIYDRIADASCILRGVMKPDSEPAAGLSPNLQAEQDRQAAAYVAAAKVAHEQEGVIEFDDAPAISMGDDPGAYVQAWIWVSAEDAGVST